VKGLRKIRMCRYTASVPHTPGESNPLLHASFVGARSKPKNKAVSLYEESAKAAGHKNKEEKRHFCAVCQKPFDSDYSLNRHNIGPRHLDKVTKTRISNITKDRVSPKVAKALSNTRHQLVWRVVHII
jgi:hypothetical protein